MAAALEVAGLSDVWVAGFATDGTDGPTSVAGAIADGETVARARRAKLDPFRSLQNNDAYPFFKKLRGHIVTAKEVGLPPDFSPNRIFSRNEDATHRVLNHLLSRCLPFSKADSPTTLPHLPNRPAKKIVKKHQEC